MHSNFCKPRLSHQTLAVRADKFVAHGGVTLDDADVPKAVVAATPVSSPTCQSRPASPRRPLRGAWREAARPGAGVDGANGAEGRPVAAAPTAGDATGHP